ncbi:unnamed protein product (macronuclear) [Paramecium tetraurelia]|uniref:Uncharacterized protein n=1 Tax=Paramecium tetraurelia TaxID=5888 RepID=A0D3F5_PARTE|nr:uncharacterized protein GSPATT00013058001 [Paramecium tetraurelia]CAK77572.1 unnamed protein product [Paramecium tetraurelia]|eukprot:XP_001444969.1 hypothetical protein (macronuclear) [Paramecium tetraurelia strain d4-2]
MQQSKLRTVSPMQCQYVSTPSNCSVGGALKRRKTLKTQSPYSSQHKESLNNLLQGEPDKNKNRCKEISIEVAKFLQQINKNESTFPSMYSSIIGIETKNQEETQLTQLQMLQQQNQILKKQNCIKQQEIDQWKQKYEQAVKQLNQLQSKYDEDIKILNQEIQAVNERITSCEQQRNYSFFDQKPTGDNLTNMSMQTFQRSINENENFIEQNKLLDEISEKNAIIKSLTFALEKSKMEISEHQLRSNGEIEQLKSKLNQIQQQKMRMEYCQSSEIQNIKIVQSNQIDILKEEINQLKCLIETKNQEISTINNQNQRYKHQIDQENKTLKQENEILKLQLIKKQQQFQEDINQIKCDCSILQQNEINSIKQSSQQQISDLDIEIKDLKEFLYTSNNTEQQQQIVDRLRQRDHYEIENQRLNSIIEEQNKRLLSQRMQTENLNTESIRKIQDLQMQCKMLLEETNQKMEQINRENTFLKNQILLKDNEINKFEDIYQKLNNYKENLLKLQEENQIILSHYEQQERQIQKEKDQQIYQLQKNFESQLKQYDFQLQNLINEKLQYMQMLEIKNQECADLNLEVKKLQIQQQNIKIDNELLYSKLISFCNSQESNRIINDPLNNTLQMKRMTEQISLLQNELLIKNKEVTQIIDKYQQLEQILCKNQIKQADQNLNEIMKNQIKNQGQVVINE